jgi:hypothetical protein
MDITPEVGKSLASRQVVLVPPHMLNNIWAQVLNIFQEKPFGILDRYTELEVWNMLVSADWQLWVAFDEDKKIRCVGITRVENYRHESVFRVVYVGGEMSRFMPEAMETIENFALVLKVDRVACDTSKGVARIMRKYGYGIRSYELSKSVKGRWRH